MIFLSHRLWAFRSIYYSPRISYRSGPPNDGSPSPGSKRMLDYVSLLLQGCAAKRKLAELFQLERFGSENQSAIAIAVHGSIPSVRPGIRESSESFREGCRKQQVLRPHEDPLALCEWHRLRICNSGVGTFAPRWLRRTFLSRTRLPDRADSVSSLG